MLREIVSLLSPLRVGWNGLGVDTSVNAARTSACATSARCWSSEEPECDYRVRFSDAHVFVEPVDGALPGQVGRGLVIAVGGRIAIEAGNGAGVDVTFVGNVGFLQGRVVGRPGRRQSRIEFAVMDQNRRLDF